MITTSIDLPFARVGRLLLVLAMAVALLPLVGTGQAFAVDPTRTEDQKLTLDDTWGIGGCHGTPGGERAVDIDGNTMVAGDCHGEYAGRGSGGRGGRTHLLTRASSVDPWAFDRYLDASIVDAPGQVAYHEGVAVAVDGDTVAAVANAAVYVFKRDHPSAGAWGLHQTLPQGGAQDVDIDLDGNHLILSRSGTVHVYARPDTTSAFGATSTDSVVLGGKLTVAADDGRLLAGVRGSNHAQVFTIVGGLLSHVATLTGSDTIGGDDFGWAVAIDGDQLAVGAPGADAGAVDAGAVYVFERVGTWTEAAKLVLNDPGASDRFGSSVDMVSGLLVGGTTFDDGPFAGGTTVADRGLAHVYERTVGGWAWLDTLAASDGSSGDQFGKSVAIGAGSIVAAQSTSAGAVPGYLYAFATPIGSAPVITSIDSPGGTRYDENSSVTINVEFADAEPAETHTYSIDWDGDGLDAGQGDVIDEPVAPAALGRAFTANHTYTDDGVSPGNGTAFDQFPIIVSVTDSAGQTGNGALPIRIDNVDPVLSNAAVDATVDENGTVEVTGDISDVGPDDAFTVTVDWGEGAPEDFAFPAGTTALSGVTHQYLDDDPTGTASDVYDLTVTLTDDDTGSDSATLSTTVGNVSPMVTNLLVDGAASTVSSSVEGDTVTMTFDLGDPGTLDTFTVEIDWETDGVIDVTDTTATTGAQSYVSPAYPDDATPTITLTVTDDDTGSVTATHDHTVTNDVPEIVDVAIDGDATPTSSDEGEQITLSFDIVDDGLVDTFDVTIDFDGDAVADHTATGVAADPSGTTTVSVPFTWVDDGASPGNTTASDDYTVSITVTDDDGDSDTDTSHTHTVDNVDPSVANVAVDGVDNGAGPEPVATTSVENDVVSLTFDVVDPGVADVQTITVAWGPGEGNDTDEFTVPATAAVDDTFVGTAGTVFTLTAIAGDTRSFAADHRYLDDMTATSGTGGGSGRVLMIEDQGGFGDAAALLTAEGFDVTVVNNEWANSRANLLDGGFLAQFALVVFGERGNGSGTQLPQPVADSLEAYVQAGGNLLVTGYDTLGSPTDSVLADLVRATSPADYVSGSGAWQTALVDHFALDGPYGDFRGVSFVATGYDDDNLNPDTGRGAIELAEIPGTTSRLIFTDVADPAGSVGYWNGGVSGTSNAQPDFSDGAEPQAIFHNWVAGTARGGANISITVEDDDAGVGSAGHSHEVTNGVPDTLALSATSPVENGSTTLTGSFADVGTIDVHTVTIDWGEGAPQVEVLGVGERTFEFTHQYLDDNPTGTDGDGYTIAVTVADDDGGSVDGDTPITVGNEAPHTVVVSATAIEENGTTTLSGTFADAGTEDVHTVDIDWDGDGVYDETVGVAAAARSFGATHQYLDDDADDSYTINVRVNDDDGAFGVGSTTVSVINVAPVAALAAAGPIDEGDTVWLDASGTTDVGTLDTHEFSWDLDGDGFYDLSTGDVATYNAWYPDSGVYTVTVRVTDDDGGVDTASIELTVDNVAPTADAGPDDATGPGNPRQLNGSGSSDPGNDIVAYDWDFTYDGVTFLGEASGVEVTYPANSAGRFTIALRVTDADGATDIDTMTMTVSSGGGGGGTPPPPPPPANNAPVAEAGGPYAGETGASIAVSAAGSSDPDGDAITYAWDLDNDGAFDDATGVNATFTSATAGSFTISVKVTDSKSASAVDSATVTVSEPDPSQPDEANRVAGPAGTSRVETAVAVSQDSYPANGSADTVVIARQDVFADALAGTAFAAGKDGPLLLTQPPQFDTALHPATKAELQRVLGVGKTVYLLGGPNALSPELEGELTALGFNPVRLAGPSRVETAIEIADATTGSPSEVFIADGNTFQSAMIAGPAAHSVGGVVILTPGAASHPAVDDYLATHSSATTTTVGTAAGTAYPAAANAYAGSSDEETSTLIAGAYFPGASHVGAARVDVFADALAGGVHIARQGGGIVLTDSSTLTPVVQSYLEANAADLAVAYIYGGTAAMSDGVRDAILTAIS